MAKAVKAVPDGYHTVTPYLVVPGVARLMDFLREAFGAAEVMRHARPDGSVQHAEVCIGDSMVMMGEPQPGSEPRPATVCLYLSDVDETYRKAIAAGGKSLREPADQFYGDRSGGVQDPCGNQWWISTHVEDVAPEELERRAAAAAKG